MLVKVCVPTGGVEPPLTQIPTFCTFADLSAALHRLDGFRGHIQAAFTSGLVRYKTLEKKVTLCRLCGN